MISVKLIWTTPEPPKELVERTERELVALVVGGLTAPEELIFHNVMDDTPDHNPVVFVYGDENNPGAFMCEWNPEAKWTVMDDFEVPGESS